MEKAFSFDEPTDEAIAAAKPHVLRINDEKFELADDVTGLQLVKLMGDANTTAGVYRLFSRTVRDEDWERFGKTTRYAKPEHFSQIATNILDLYTSFPISAVGGS